jgi:hypothetical protein
MKVHIFSSANESDENRRNIFVGCAGRRKRYVFSSFSTTDENSVVSFVGFPSRRKYWICSSIFVGYLADENTGRLLKKQLLHFP